MQIYEYVPKLKHLYGMQKYKMNDNKLKTKDYCIEWKTIFGFMLRHTVNYALKPDNIESFQITTKTWEDASN